MQSLQNVCSSDSSEDFPNFLTSVQVLHGGFILAVCIAIYSFTFLAVVCDKYFLPSVERICEALNLAPNVAAATFMSIATSVPEMFTNVIGTFVTESDLGIGTIVGSSLFNALGVASLGGIAAAKPIQLDWWPITRDVVIYIFAVCLLIGITWDSTIFWYEAMTLFIVYIVYFIIMFNNERIVNTFKKVFHIGTVKASTTHTRDDFNAPRRSFSLYGSYRLKDVSNLALENHRYDGEIYKIHLDVLTEPKRSSIRSELSISTKEKTLATVNEMDVDSITVDQEEKSKSIKSIIFYYYLLPIKIFLKCTVPDPIKYPRLFPISFIMCIVFIGGNSYIVSWMLTNLGTAFKIPDVVLGMTLLAAGGCLPEGVSLTIMSRRGEGSMGVSNSLGGMTMNILLSLGLPWFIKTISMGVSDDAFIVIESGAIEYSIFLLIGAVIILFITLYFNKFQLRKRVGMILLPIYFCIISLGIVLEMVVFKTNTC